MFGLSNFLAYGHDWYVQHVTSLAGVAAEEGTGHFVFSGVGSHGEDTFGFELPDLKVYLREHDWAEKSEPSLLPAWRTGKGSSLLGGLPRGPTNK